MKIHGRVRSFGVVCCALLASASTATAQNQRTESPWVVDLGIGIAPSIKGNINSGAIGTLNGQATAILPNSYGNVYGTGLDFRFGGGYQLDKDSELRGTFIYQKASANLVRLGDIGPSSLYGQFSDYKSFGLDFGYRRYLTIAPHGVRVFGEAGIGVGFISRINVLLAAPQSNIIFNSTDFYDRTAAFTWNLSIGAAMPVSDQIDLTAQVGFRHVSGLAQVDQLVGTGLETINNDSARLTFPIVVGARFRFK
jgi:hypothetical protein